VANELHFAPAHELIAQLRAKKISATELLGVFEKRHAEVNPGLNAIVATDWDGARARAKDADAKLARGDAGPLTGLPITLKDAWEVAGMTTVVGSPALKDYRPKVTAPSVQRLIDAGANPFGKTNTPLFCQDIQTYNSVFGVTNNPYDVARTCGGSSGGAAAAVAAGLTGLELGSDLAGSIRTPAHFCGVYGHKPTFGFVPYRGHVPGPPGTINEPDLVVAGPMARSAQDLALALPLVAGPLPPLSQALKLTLPPPRVGSLAEYRVAAWFDDPSCEIDLESRALFEEAVSALTRAGAKVTRGAPLGLTLEAVYADFFFLMAAMIGNGIPEKQYSQARTFGALAHLFARDVPNTLAGFSHRATRSLRQWAIAHEQREKLRMKLEGYFREFDILLMPVANIPAPLHNNRGTPYDRRIDVNGRAQPYADQFKWISLATLAGLPATSAPIGRTRSGLPVNIQIVSAHGQDLSTIDFARRLAERVGGYTPPTS
jgi:amidase